MNSRKKILAGNWKMNLSVSESEKVVESLLEYLPDVLKIEVVIAPTHLSLYPVIEKLKKINGRERILIAAQNTHYQDNGAYTGEVSVSMLKDIGVSYCIVGHSERRNLFGETDKTINQKVSKLWKENLHPIMCIGETLAERDANRWKKVVSRQLNLGLMSLNSNQVEKTIIAYEPVWAIGTGVSASPNQAQEVHQFIRKELSNYTKRPEKVTLLYGGSVNSKNSRDLFSQPDIDGGLVGASSLKADEFSVITQSFKL